MGANTQTIIDLCIAEDSLAGKRDAAIFALMAFAGVGRRELARLTTDALDLESQTLHLPQRTLVLQNDVWTALVGWLNVRGSEPGPLFYPIYRGGHLHKTKLSATAVRDVLLRRSCGLLSPRKLRRLHLCKLAAEGCGIREIQKLTGYRSADTIIRHLEEANGGGEIGV